MKLSKRSIISLASFKDLITTNTRKLMKDKDFHRAPVKSNVAKKDRCSTVYVKNVAEVFLKQVKFCGKEDITFHLEPGSTLLRAASPCITTNYIQTWY